MKTQQAMYKTLAISPLSAVLRHLEVAYRVSHLASRRVGILRPDPSTETTFKARDLLRFFEVGHALRTRFSCLLSVLRYFFLFGVWDSLSWFGVLPNLHTNSYNNDRVSVAWSSYPSPLFVQFCQGHCLMISRPCLLLQFILIKPYKR